MGHLYIALLFKTYFDNVSWQLEEKVSNIFINILGTYSSHILKLGGKFVHKKQLWHMSTLRQMKNDTI